MLTRKTKLNRPRGFSMIEVLITILILSFGLLGLAGLQTRTQVAQFESQQRAAAVLLLADMSDRIRVNPLRASEYVRAEPVGTSDALPTSCATVALGPARDICQWSNALKGAAEQSGTNQTGAMIGARGCITQLQASNSSPGVCTPGVYRIAVAWQGMHATVAPGIACAPGAYGNDALRRVIAAEVTIGLPECS